MSRYKPETACVSMLGNHPEFFTSSRSFVEIPSMHVDFEIPSEGQVFISGYIWVWGEVIEIAFRVDEGDWVAAARLTNNGFAGDHEIIAPLSMALLMPLSEGLHRVSMGLRDASDHEDDDPRHWSPRPQKELSLVKAVVSAEKPGLIQVL